MSLTRTQARDEVFALIKAGFDTATVSAVVPSKHVIYQDSRTGSKPSSDEEPIPGWARVQMQHNAGSQAGINNRVEGRCFERSGLVTIQLFTPQGGLVKADSVAEELESVFLGISTAGGVWFRNVRSLEIGEDGPWFQTNILAEFEYNQVR